MTMVKLSDSDTAFVVWMSVRFEAKQKDHVCKS